MELTTNNAKESNCLEQQIVLGKESLSSDSLTGFFILHYSLIKLEIKLSTSAHGNNYLQLCIMFNFKQ